MKLAELHWPEVKKLNREKIVAVVPVPGPPWVMIWT